MLIDANQGQDHNLRSSAWSFWSICTVFSFSLFFRTLPSRLQDRHEVKWKCNDVLTTPQSHQRHYDQTNSLMLFCLLVIKAFPVIPSTVWLKAWSISAISSTTRSSLASPCRDTWPGRRVPHLFGLLSWAIWVIREWKEWAGPWYRETMHGVRKEIVKPIDRRRHVTRAEACPCGDNWADILLVTGELAIALFGRT